MSIVPPIVRSVLLTSLLSFVMPWLFVAIALASLCLVSYIPQLTMLGNAGAQLVLQVLATFGSGNALHGITIVGVTCAFVGALFDAFASARYQHVRNQ
jgi:hypothetical protein